MWWVVLLLPLATTLPLQGFQSQPLDVQQFSAQNLQPNRALPFAPGVNRPSPMMMEPLETTTRDFPTSGAPVPLPQAAPVDRTIDLNGDGQLSLAEVQYAAFVHHGLSASVIKHLFEQVDINKDGVLNGEEFDSIKPLVLEKAENAALRYLQSVDTDHNKLLSLKEAQTYLLKEYGIGYRDVERIWRLVNDDITAEMNAAEFSKLRRRIRGMTIRLARQIMKAADSNGDGHISLDEAQAIAFEQEGIQAGDVTQMMASVDDNQDGELNAPEFADFERIIRSRAVETSKKALKVVDADNSGTVTMDEAKRIAFEHYGFDEEVLAPFFDQADEDENGQLDVVEFAGFRTVIRSRAVKNAVAVMREVDLDGDSLINLEEAAEKTRAEDDMDTHETKVLFNIADQNKSGKLDKVEFADFLRLVRLSAIRFAADHFKEFDRNGDGLVTESELADLIQAKYGVPPSITTQFFEEVDIDNSKDLIPAEIVDFRHVIRRYVRLGGEGRGREVPNSAESRVEKPTTKRKLTFSRKTTSAVPEAVTTTEQTTSSQEYEKTTKKRIGWVHWSKTTTAPSTTVSEKIVQEERRRIIEKQKKELNIPEETEVEYLDTDSTTKSSDQYEVVEYEEGSR